VYSVFFLLIMIEGIFKK